MTTSYLTRRDVELLPVVCPTADCDERDEVAVYREAGHAEFLDDMPTCGECGVEMEERDEV